MRVEVDALRKIKREVKEVRKEIKALKTSQKFWGVFLVVLFFVALANICFWGTVAALEVKDRANILKLFDDGRYLVLFQNNAEMRPTGGFLGSFAVIDFKDFAVTNIDFNTNIYKLDNAYIAQNTVVPPAPLATINQGKWAMHDANWSPDYPQAAQTIQWFYQQESGNKVDGVIALNASTIQELLRLTGPVELKDYNTTISADNFFEELATKIEKEYFYHAQNKEENEPKTILKDLMPLLIEKVKTVSKLELLKLVLTELSHKQILLQSNDQAIQQAILSSGWGGKVAETTGDYLYVNNANLTDTSQNKNFGAKSSLKIKESIDYNVTNKTGQLVSDLTLTRSHVGSYLWPDGVNINWTRILVPSGSILTSAELNGKDIADSIEVGDEAGKTSFSLWLNTAPQTSNVLRIQYQLPILPSDYQLTVQKQPGNLGDDLRVSYENKVIFNGTLDSDKEIK